QAIKAPLRFDGCFDNDVLAEPLPELMTAVMSAVLVAKEKGREVSEHVAMFENIVERLVKADLSDFDITKDSDFVSDSESSKKIKAIVDLLWGVYDVALEYLLSDSEVSDDTIELVFNIFRKTGALKNFMKERLKSKKGFGAKFAHTPASCGLGMRVHVLHKLFGAGDEFLPKLRNNAEFTHHVLIDTLSILAKATTHSNPIDIEAPINQLGQIFFCEILEKTLINLYQPKSPDRGIFTVAVEGFEKLFEFVLAELPDSVNDFLKALIERCGGVDDGSHDGELRPIDAFVKSVQKLIGSVLDANVPYPREAVLLIKCLSDLWTFLDQTAVSTNVEYDAESLGVLTITLQDWALDLWGQHQGKDSVLSKALIGLFCKMQRVTSDSDAMCKLVACVQSSFAIMLEDKDDESQRDEDNDVGEISEKELSILYSIHHLGDTIQCGRELGTSSMDRIQMEATQTWWTDIQQLNIENVIFLDLTGITNVVWNIMRTEFPSDSGDIVFGTIIRVFKVVNGLLKYKITSGNMTNKFEELIELVTRKLRDKGQGIVDVIPCMQERDTKESENALALPIKKGASLLFKKRKRSSRESKTMPTLIFETEQFDRYLIALHKKQKTFNLMRFVKRSTARDFKIQERKIVEKEGMKKEKKAKTEH
ncbi:UNVERIFIED_CONTAM: hypothetical protein HDU68_012392, partial [Siphonaria sp. JEL0065]